MLQLILQRYYPEYKELESIFQISEPLLYSFQIEDKKHIVYVLQNRSILTQKGVANIFEVLVGESTTENIDRFLASNILIREALSNSKNKQRIGVVNEKVYPPKQINDMESIRNRIPEL